MEVKLLAATTKPLETMYIAARTCYSEDGPIQLEDNLPNDDVKWKLIEKVLKSGHQSIAEHISFTFAIEGISRACSHQLVRHRAGIVFSQQSQRYVEIKETEEELGDAFSADYDNINYKDSKIFTMIDKYFTENTFKNVNGYFYALDQYLYATENGEKPEDARRFLPNGTKTNITMSVNYRELIHICGLRLCTRAQKEIRDLFGLIKKEVEKVEPRLAEYLVPRCEVYGVCFEGKCCGRKPSIKELQTTYKVAKNDMDDILSETDWDMLMDSIKNPKVNDNLRKLMEMESVLNGD